MSRVSETYVGRERNIDHLITSSGTHPANIYGIPGPDKAAETPTELPVLLLALRHATAIIVKLYLNIQLFGRRVIFYDPVRGDVVTSETQTLPRSCRHHVLLLRVSFWSSGVGLIR